MSSTELSAPAVAEIPRLRMSGRWWRPSAPTTLALLWVLLLPLLYLFPTLLHGTKLGSEDILTHFGVMTQPGAEIHNPLSSDQIEEMMPWADLDWKQVHAGDLPLWNPYSGYGLPLLANFVSAAFSLPMLVAYAGPERFVYTIEMLVKLWIAGFGVLWCCRRLGLGWLSSTFGATAFTLSGAFAAWLGWPMTGTTAWLGWAVGAAVLIVRSREKRILHGCGLAVSIAFVCYAGHPETLIVVALCTAAFVTGELVRHVSKSGRLQAAVPPLVTLGMSAVGALALAAPLLLPGLPILSQANRAGVIGYALPHKLAINVLLSGYTGFPTAGSQYFGASNYYESAAYVGAIVLTLAISAMVIRRHDPVVIVSVLLALGIAVVTYSTKVIRFLDTLPVVKNVQWSRSLIALDFVLALLAALGLETIIRRRWELSVRISFLAAAVLLAIVTGALWIHHVRAHLPEPARHIQADSFVWPFISVVTLLLAAAFLCLPDVRAIQQRVPVAVTARIPAAVGFLLFAIESAFLLTAAPRLWSSSDAFFPTTAAVDELRTVVGTSRVGFEACPSILSFPSLGILPEANDAYGVSEAAAYDGVVPKSYFTAYYAEIHQPVPAYTGFGDYCPSFTSATVARHFGVEYILGEHGMKPPAGTSLVAEINDEDVYRVPGAGVISIEPTGAAPDAANAMIPATTSPQPSTIRTRVRVSAPSTVYFHVTDFPGWSATIDGRSLKLNPWGGAMLAASIPTGQHVISISYYPSSFRTGFLLAILALVGMGAALTCEYHFDSGRPRHNVSRVTAGARADARTDR